jgi:hypothetical protein
MRVNVTLLYDLLRAGIRNKVDVRQMPEAVICVYDAGRQRDGDAIQGVFRRR